MRRADKGHQGEMDAFRDAIRGRPSALLGVDAAYAATDLALRIDAAVSRVERS